MVSIVVACGDGFTQGYAGEVCDPGVPGEIAPDYGTSTCQSFDDPFGDPYTDGAIACEDDCSAFDTSNCYTCGNGAKEAVEECDGADLGGLTCINLGYQEGLLSCTADCKLNTTDCIPAESEPGVAGGGASGGGIGNTSGFNPGSEDELVTKVIATGKSYPHANVHILVDGVVVGIVETDAKADFYFETTEVSPGVASFGFWSEDKDGFKSTLLTLTFRVISGAVTTISGVYIAPSINIDKKSVRQGEAITIYGQTVPDTEVHVHINSEQEFIEKLDSHAESGNWELEFNTEPLEEDFHTAKALFQIAAGDNVIQSGFSRSVSFHVGKVGGEVPCPEADLNQDGRVNLTDFSILLYYWGTDNVCADQNQNGVVDLVDFSIMMYYWTG